MLVRSLPYCIPCSGLVRADFGEFYAEQIGCGVEFGAQVAGAGRLVVRDAGCAPGVYPFTGVQAEVDSRGCVVDLQEWAWHNRAG